MKNIEKVKTFFNKIKILLKLIIRVKIIISTPNKQQLVIFDDTSLSDLEILLKKYNYYVLKTRLENIDVIYLNIKIIKNTYTYYQGSIMSAYLCAIIHCIEPKTVLTFIDNSLKFSELAKFFYGKINFIAIQNGSRIDSLSVKSKLFIPNFFCFGRSDVDQYRKYNIKVDKFYVVGSLRLSNFIKKVKNTSKKNNLFDICFIADDLIHDFEKELNIKHTKPGIIKLAKYVVKFCIKNNLSLITIYKDDESKINFKKLKAEASKIFNKKEELFFINSLNKIRYNQSNSYKIIQRSEVLCGSISTMLKEKLALGGKILSCNFMLNKIFDFPNDGICRMDNCSFFDFEKRLLEVHSMPIKRYFLKIKKDKSYTMFFKKKISTIKLIQSKLDQFL
jgi:surface carbohydrate biosynthesis protein